MASSLNICLEVVWVKPGLKGFMVKIQIQEKLPEQILDSIKIIMMGKEGVGKSTLLGVLLTGEEDDGDGCIRMLTVKHKYEMDVGTSTINNKVLGFDSKGCITNYDRFGDRLSMQQIIEKSSKLVTLFDFAGNEKFAKTTNKGITSYFPDYAMIFVDGEAEKADGESLCTQETKDLLNIAWQMGL
eukprot:CAMPEP_0202966516 /NCGR_PEP_ID=MMETSP1396-20130829/10960_1 /ASSEMBLY_ACC=CAM_ASM_000872 /TAXON_ID= /ORGANISM="Pseudokeronopsis sp., Strain Brazil" /LENGTH=184 /DNA_ID=CAMNT_0049690471 /DNA_START=307 /DNA_END=861 /DNA_ORIENTATION=+